MLDSVYRYCWRCHYCWHCHCVQHQRLVVHCFVEDVRSHFYSLNYPNRHRTKSVKIAHYALAKVPKNDDDDHECVNFCGIWLISCHTIYIPYQSHAYRVDFYTLFPLKMAILRMFDQKLNFQFVLLANCIGTCQRDMTMSVGPV